MRRTKESNAIESFMSYADGLLSDATPNDKKISSKQLGTGDCPLNRVSFYIEKDRKHNEVRIYGTNFFGGSWLRINDNGEIFFSLHGHNNATESQGIELLNWLRKEIEEAQETN